MKVINSDKIDRMKVRACDFAEWLQRFYVPVDEGWVCKHGNKKKAVYTSDELYNDFIKKVA